MTARSTGLLRRFQQGDLDFNYLLVYSARRTIGLHIYPDGRVIVRAPRGCAQTIIDDVLARRVRWLARHLARARHRPAIAAPRRYVTGEQVALLGEPLQLVVQPGRRARICLEEGRLIVETVDPARVERLIRDWYKRQAQRVFEQRLAVCFERVRGWGVTYPDLRVRRMRTRWGSCSSRGTITLNARLVELPVDLIDYVVLHELCHLREMNHGPRFYALLGQICPQWRAQRARIRQITIE